MEQADVSRERFCPLLAIIIFPKPAVAENLHAQRGDEHK